MVFTFFSRYEKIIANFSYLTLLQLCNLVIPLMTYPYLIHVLGDEIYGTVIFVQAIVSYLAIFVNFGFNISATKTISAYKDNVIVINEVCSAVYIIKGIFFFSICVILLLLYLIIPGIYRDNLLFVLSMWLCLYELLFPIWFFQGMEQMKYIAMFSFVSRLLFLFLIFILIKDSSDYLFVPVINGLGGLLSVIISLYILRCKYRVSFILLPIGKLVSYSREAGSLFLTSVTGIIKDKTNTVIIGISLNMSDVTYYDFIDKIVNILSTFFYTIGNVMFPHYNANRKLELAKKVLLSTTFLAIVLYVLTGIFLKDFILLFFNENLLKCVSIYWILAPIFIFRHVSYYLGTVFLISHNYVKDIIVNMFYSMLFYIVGIGICYLLDMINLYTISIVLVLSVGFEALNRFYYCKKRGII